MPASLIGVLMAIGRALAVPAVFFVPLVIGRWGHFRAIVAGTLGMALSLLLLALVPHWGAASLGYVGLTALGLVVKPAFTVYSQEMVPARARGLMSGATTMAAGVGTSALALGGGYLITARGFPSLFMAAAGLAATAALAFWSSFRAPRASRARTSPAHGSVAEGQAAS
jgi:predicted MFS family arabinose efflux permease